MRTKEQKLIDIMFQIGITTHGNTYLQKLDQEEYCEWIRDQLGKCVFEVIPMGMSNGVLMGNKL